MASINIIARTNGVGLDRDVSLVQQCLTAAGHDVTVSHCRAISPLRALIPSNARYDANIFLERIFSRWVTLAEKNFLIPNQERYPLRHLAKLKKIDHILCKSRHAEEIFKQHGRTEFIGFTSTDMFDSAIKKDYQSILHLAGRSTLKGTETILNLWKKHPEWPSLTLIQCEENAPDHVPANVNLISDYISDEEMKHHLNTHGIHLCTSLSEGWGHYIVEAMSCKAVTVTTDAPPMNELISPVTGIPVPYDKCEPRHLGTNFFVAEKKLESNISRLLMMTDDEKQSYGDKARAWFTENHQSFQKRFSSLMNQHL